MEKKRRFKGILATALIISMMMQLVVGAAPVYTWEEPEETWREEAGLQKTISVSESEIRDSLKAWKWAPELDEEIIPFEEPQKEAAIKVLEQKLDGAVIVRQEELGDDCSAIVAVRAEEKRKNADIHNIVLIGLNGNEDEACEFVLEIVNEGGIVVKRTVITEYGTDGPWATPSDATPSDATPSDATPSEATESDADPEEEELEAHMGDIMLIDDLSSPITAPVSKATSSNYNKEETGEFFSRSYTYALEPNEINGMVMNEEEVEEEKPNLFMRIARFFSFNNGDEEDDVPLATESNIAEKEDGAADVDSIPAVMYAMPGSMAIAETADMITSYHGNRMYFVNMFDPLFAPAFLLESADGDRSVTYATVEAVFTQPGGNNNEKIVPMSYYEDGVYVCQIPRSDEEIKYDAENPNPVDKPEEIIPVKKPYTKVTFRVKVQESVELPDESNLEIDKDGYLRIGRTYRFLGQGTLQPDMGTLEYVPIDRDTLFYNGRNDAERTETSYWGAHPIRTPQTLDGEFIYFDVRERDAEGNLTGNLLTGMDGEKPYLWLHYNCEGTQDCGNHQITLKTTTDGIYYYQFPYESGADEDTVLVLRGRNEGSESGQNPGFPFTWSLKEDRNMVVLNNLLAGGNKWANYNPSFLEGDRYIGFDNTLVGFEPGDTNATNDEKRDQVMAVVWECETPGIEEGTSPNPEKEHAHWAWDEEEFLKLCSDTTEDEIWHLETEDDETQTAAGSVYVGMLKPTRETDKDEQGYTDEMWNQVKTVWGIRLPEEMKWENTHIRFIHYTGKERFYSDKNGQLLEKENSEQPSAEKQVEVLKALAEQLKETELGKKDGKPVYGNSNIHEFSQILTVDNSFDYPCFYSAPGHNKMPMHGYWDRLRSPNRLGDESLNIPKGDFKFDSTVYYGSADFYDYYSDYELTGHNRADKLATEDGFEDNPYPVTQDGEWAAISSQLKDEYKFGGKSLKAQDYFNMQGTTLNTAIFDYYMPFDPSDDETDKMNLQYKSLYFAPDENRNNYRERPVDLLTHAPDQPQTGLDDVKTAQYSSHKWRNRWRAWRRVPGIMQNSLNEKGNLTAKTGEIEKEVPYFSESFLRGNNSQNVALGTVYNNVLFPFQKDESGYWTFDSTKPTHAVRMKQDNQSDMYFLEQGTDHAVLFNHGENPMYIFMPFSDPLFDGNKKISYGGITGHAGYDHYEKNAFAKLNYMLGMKISIPFTLPEDGKVEMPVLEDGKPTGETKKEDVVFRFSGDDDVWIFVDGQLALDIGGIHNFITGEINFAEQTITYRNYLQGNAYINNTGYSAGNMNPNLNGDGSINWDKAEKEGTWQDVQTYKWTGEPVRAKLGTDGKPLKDENGHTVWEKDTHDPDMPVDSIAWSKELQNFKNEGQHEITIFYMERGLIASNLRMTFNFTMNNSFEVENEVDISNIEHKVDVEQTMDPRFKDLANQIDSFDFNIETAATKGVPKPVDQSLGYIKAGGTKEYNSLKDPDKGMVGLHWKDTAGSGGTGQGNGASDVWIAEIGSDPGEGGSNIGKAIFRSWGETDTHIEEEELERRLINIYPPSGKGNTAVWPEEIESGNTGDDGNPIMTEAAYMSLQVENSGDVSENGSILYVGLIDNQGHRVGGWANTLTYGGSSNRIGKGWNTIRIDKEKLLKTAQDGEDFDMKAIKAVQLCYYDEREGAVRDIKFHGEPDLSQEINGFYVEDKDISDYGSVKVTGDDPTSEENTTRYSKLRPAYGAWYNTESYVHDSEPDPEENNQRQPAMVGEEGSFQLGPGGSALFTDKFRVGSYISVKMQDLSPRIFTTTWTLTEDGEKIRPAWLSANANTQNLEYEQITVNPWDQPGRSPKDGRHQAPYAAHETIVNNNKNQSPELEDANTVLFRSYQYPDDASNGFHTGVRFNTVMDTARIVVKKELLEGVPEKADGYHFAIVYDDIADMGLELSLRNPFVGEGFTLKAGEAKCFDVLAGTHYRIYELDTPLEKQEVTEDGKTVEKWMIDGKEPASIEDLLPYISQSLDSVRTGWAEQTGANKWEIRDEDTNHTDVTTYSKGTGSAELVRNGHASGTAYTKDEQGKDGRGEQGFVFTNGPAPVPGQGTVTLSKKDAVPNEEGKDSPLAGAMFELHYSKDGGETFELWAVQKTDADGKIIIENLPVGKYYFVETQPPAGYQPNSKHYEFEITEADPDVEISVDVLNWPTTEGYGRVILTKRDKDSKVTLAGAVFDLYRWTGADAPGYDPWDVPEGTTSLWHLYREDETTGADGKLQIDKLPYGYYALFETDPPEGYVIPENENDESRWKRFVINSTDGVVTELEMFNESRPIARFRVQKVVTSHHENSEDAEYQDDPFLIKVKELDAKNGDGFYTELVLRHYDTSEDIIVDLGEDRQGMFQIQEIIPMEYELVGMELRNDKTEDSVLKVDESTGSGTLTLKAGADVTVRVKNKEKHTPYFHDTAYVTNTTSNKADWTFEEKRRDPDGSKNDKTPLAFLIPDQDGKRGKKEDDEQNDSAE